MIDFNRPYLTGKELEYIDDAVKSKKISGNGKYTHLCQNYLAQKYGFKKCLLTTSCTDALEMCAMLIDIQPGDEVIVPSYTFVSTALAFVRAGAKIVFADSERKTPNIDSLAIEPLITSRTKAIVPVHYAGIACDMDTIMQIANKYNLYVIEDAAQAIDSYYKGRALGSIGHLAAFSFHETKNIIAGEGGLLAINDERFIKRSEIIWEKGTNRAEFFRGEVNKYGWVDVGSSFLPSELVAAFLWAQLESIDKVQKKRKELWNCYYENLKSLEEAGKLCLPYVPDYATNNAHMFYVICSNIEIRTRLISVLKSNEIQAVFHYLSLNDSEFYKKFRDSRKLSNCAKYTDCLLRLPMYYELCVTDIERICTIIKNELE